VSKVFPDAQKGLVIISNQTLMAAGHSTVSLAHLSEQFVYNLQPFADKFTGGFVTHEHPNISGLFPSASDNTSHLSGRDVWQSCTSHDMTHES